MPRSGLEAVPEGRSPSKEEKAGSEDKVGEFRRITMLKSWYQHPLRCNEQDIPKTR